MGAFECDSIGGSKISLDQIGILFQNTINDHLRKLYIHLLFNNVLSLSLQRGQTPM